MWLIKTSGLSCHKRDKDRSFPFLRESIAFPCSPTICFGFTGGPMIEFETKHETRGTADIEMATVILDGDRFTNFGSIVDK
jgi:hypothetical protein